MSRFTAPLSYTEVMRTPEIIVTHTNTDFDAFAAMVAAHKLYPEAQICLGGAINRNVREFQALFADLVAVVDPTDVDHRSVRRLIMVDTVHANRLGDLADLCTRDGVQVLAFDHHQSVGELPPYLEPDALVSSTDGSLVTLLVHIIAERGLPVTPFEATVFALGIHEDTGSLTFATTTAADAEALAICMRAGADVALLEKWLANALTAPQRRTLAAALESAEELPLPGAHVLLSALRQDLYVEGVSVIAHRVMDLTGCDACFLLVAMEGRVFVTARSRGLRLDVARALAPIGGGGHAAAASAVVKDMEMADVAAAIVAAVPGALAPVRTGADVLQPQPLLVDAGTSVDDVARLCRRRGLGGAVVTAAGVLVGRVALADVDRAAAHGLGHAPVKAVTTSSVSAVGVDAPMEHIALVLAQDDIGWLPAVEGNLVVEARGSAASLLLGMVTRRALTGGGEAAELAASAGGANLAGELGELQLGDLLRHIQAVAAGVRGVYLVGGAVRDLLLGEPGFDVDLAVEGDGIAFAHDLAARLNGHMRPHQKFGTAVVVADKPDGERLRVDVASTRAESYAYPGALPKIEHAGIRSDLARRDFTINAMAVSLKPESFGDLLDCFGGSEDLSAGRIVVLHNLSFIEDPTRILRAVRYETRYGLRMDEHTLNLARACCAMDLVGDLSSARLRDELVLLLSEAKVDFSLRRLEDLDLWPSVHGRLRVDAETRELVRRSDALREQHGLAAELPRWRLRLVWLLRDLDPEEIAAWAGRMHVRRRDAEVIARALVVGDRLATRVARGPSEAELDEIARTEPLEALVAAMVLDRSGSAAHRLGRYVDTTRHIHLEIGGRDLLELGFASGPGLGEVLRSVLHLKINGVVATRDEELEAASRLRERES